MKKKLNLFLQLAKIDEAKREVWGIATAEVVDKDGEIFDYETSKPYFKSWSDEISKATDGKSLGNVREMHTSSAVGKLVDLTFDDEQKQIQVGAKIVDEAAWIKCAEGVYTGFSIGGQYVKIWKDGEFSRFTANPAEISVVDNPAVSTAHFTAVKADGTSEVRKFAHKAEGQSPTQPVNTGRNLEKDMYSVSNLASLLQSAVYLQMDSQYEAEYEADDSPIPGELKDWVKQGAAILARMTEEELNELTARMKSAKDKLGKKGAKHSAETRAHHEAISKAVDKCMKLMGDCQKHCDALMGKDDMEAAAQAEVHKDSPETAEIPQGEQPEMLEAKEKQQLEKAAADSSSALSKMTELEKTVTELKAGQDEIGKALGNLTKALEKMSGVGDKPAQTVARTAVTVNKEDDTPAAAVEEKDPMKKAMRETYNNPRPAFDYLRKPAEQ